jgi:hypothetical protein
MIGDEHSKPVDVDSVLDEILADAHGDDAQLCALHRAISDALELPTDVHVVGEPVSLVAVDYDGNPRRGLVARCRREDGSEHRIGFADVQLRTGVAGYPCLAAYCTWLGIEPVASGPASISSTKPRRHKASEDDIDISKPVDLVVLAVKQRAARCRLLGSERVITLRAGSLHSVVAGQIATVQPNKQWRHAGHPYLSGQITATRIDAAALGLVPLELRDRGAWDPSKEYWGEEGQPIEDWAKPIIARGPRPQFEMEQVLPGSDPDDFDSDPILAANDLKDAGGAAEAQELLARLLEVDLRCLDAHAHLGNMLFRHSPHWALSHYEVGIRIGELSLGDSFDGVLGWGPIDNRPFLRCMQGYALCLWRLKRWEQAERVFDRMLWLNPSDNQGVGSLLPSVRAHRPWVDDEA